MLALRFCKILFLLYFACACIHAQDSAKIQKIKTKSLSSQADEVEVLFKKGADSKSIAGKFEEIGREFKLNGQNDKAIVYFNKAVSYYKKGKDKQDASRLLREIAQIQESEKSFKEAASSYEKSAAVSNSSASRNDAARISEPSIETKIEYNQQNISLFPSNTKDETVIQDKAFALTNQAKMYEQVGKKEEALNYSIEALEVLNNKSIESRELQKMKVEVASQIADLYLKNDQIDNALSSAISARQLALESNDWKMVVQSSSELSEYYQTKNDPENALLVLKDAYRIALKSGRTLDAREALLALSRFFSKSKNQDAMYFFYEDFINQLDTLIARDSSILDEKIFYAKEERIEQLEKERDLTDQLLNQSRNWNYGMIVFFVFLFAAAAFLFWSLLKLRMQNKKIALQSLRREMNPHFVFNSLNSVNRFIAQNDEIKANNYLTSYAQLMRTTMEISSQDFIRLDKEIELLTKYLDLEHLRFGQHFDYQISIEESIESENLSIPGFLIQPHLENAIWHGLRYKKEKGLLLLKITQNKGQILVSIEDNGIGIEESKKLKTENQKSHQSRGFSNIKERIELLNSLYHFKIDMQIKSPNSENLGTTVLIILPKINAHGKD